MINNLRIILQEWGEQELKKKVSIFPREYKDTREMWEFDQLKVYVSENMGYIPVESESKILVIPPYFIITIDLGESEIPRADFAWTLRRLRDLGINRPKTVGEFL